MDETLRDADSSSEELFVWEYLRLRLSDNVLSWVRLEDEEREIVVVTDREADNSSEGESDNDNVLDPDRVAESSFVAESVADIVAVGVTVRDMDDSNERVTVGVDDRVSISVGDAVVDGSRENESEVDTVSVGESVMEVCLEGEVDCEGSAVRESDADIVRVDEMSFESEVDKLPLCVRSLVGVSLTVTEGVSDVVVEGEIEIVSELDARSDSEVVRVRD